MVTFLFNIFVKDKNKNTIGKACGILGIVFNLFLFVSKYTIGVLVSSISISADAFNNLSDALSNILAIVSFHFANKPADKNHPFGHERTEAISSFLIALMTGYIGLELCKQSIMKILHPSTITFKWVTVLVLVISIVVKLYMYAYNHRLSKQYNSELLAATALDSISDVWATSGVLLSTIVSSVLHFNLDGYVGLIVACLILWNAYQLLREEINTLLGKAPDQELVQRLQKAITQSDIVLGVHDIVIHQYGADNIFASAHVEVDASLDILMVHDEIDNIEQRVRDGQHMDLVLHMDPIQINDPLTNTYKDALVDALKKLDQPWTFHDFRIVKGPTHTNLVFDLVVPYECPYSQSEIEEMLKSALSIDTNYYIILTIDHPMS